MNSGAHKYSTGTAENTIDTIFISPSTEKPDIPDDVTAKWQNMMDLAAQLLTTSGVFITRIVQQHLSVLVVSKSVTEELPPGHSVPLDEKNLQCILGIPQKASSGPPHKDVVIQSRNLFDEDGDTSLCSTPLLWNDGELLGTLCILTQSGSSMPTLAEELLCNFKKIVESDLCYLTITTSLQKRLSTQEFINREAHHRINNHFTMLISYIQLQILEGTSRDPQNILLDIQNRIRSISVIHEELCSTSTHKELPPLNEYISRLCNCLASNISRYTIDIQYNVERLKLPVERSVSIGLILAELVTNSIKYAFSEHMTPEITVRIFRKAKNRITLQYSDNGIGLPADFRQKRSDTLGMNLIEMQIEQFHGTLKILEGRGARFEITLDG